MRYGDGRAGAGIEVGSEATTAGRRGAILVPVLLLTALVIAWPAESQTLDDVDPRILGNGPLVLELSASTRAAGLGGAWTGSDTDAVFHHPALITGGGASLAHQTYGDAATHITASGGTEWWGGAVAVGVSMLEHGAPSGGLSDLRRDEAALAIAGPVATSAFVASAGYARDVAWGLRGGVVGKMVGLRLGAARATSPAMDLGVSMEAGPVTVAASAQNLGPELDLDGEALPLAHRVVLSAFTERTPLGPLDVGLAAQVVRDGGGEVAPGGGVEIAWWPVVGRTFIFRLGGRAVPDGTASPLSVGGGFAGDRIRIDYSYQGFDTVDGAHRVGVSFR